MPISHKYIIAELSGLAEVFRGLADDRNQQVKVAVTQGRKRELEGEVSGLLLAADIVEDTVLQPAPRNHDPALEALKVVFASDGRRWKPGKQPEWVTLAAQAILAADPTDADARRFVAEAV